MFVPQRDEFLALQVQRSHALESMDCGSKWALKLPGWWVLALLQHGLSLLLPHSCVGRAPPAFVSRTSWSSTPGLLWLWDMSDMLPLHFQEVPAGR